MSNNQHNTQNQASETEQNPNVQQNSPKDQQTSETYSHFVNSLNWFERFLLFLSKTELFIMQYCTNHTKQVHTAIGGMVLVTGILAFISSFFTIEMIFFKTKSGLEAFLIPLSIATIYAIAIMAFDREIVSATTKSAAFLRIPFAILIGIVIAFPIELKLQEGRIETEIVKMIEQEHPEINKLIEDIKTQKGMKNNLEQSLKDLADQTKKHLEDESKMQMSKLAIIEKLSKIQDESLLKEQRRLLAGLQRPYKRDPEKEIDKKTKQIQQDLKNINAEIEQKEEKLRMMKAEVKSRSNDLLTQALALKRIHNDPMYGKTATTISMLLMLFFVCFELFPVLIKLFLPYNEYSAYLDARTRLNVNKIITCANIRLSQLANSQERIILDKTEITDAFVELMEDKSIDSHRTGVTKNPKS